MHHRGIAIITIFSNSKAINICFLLTHYHYYLGTRTVRATLFDIMFIEWIAWSLPSKHKKDDDEDLNENEDYIIIIIY